MEQECADLISRKAHSLNVIVTDGPVLDVYLVDFTIWNDAPLNDPEFLMLDRETLLSKLCKSWYYYSAVC